MPSISAPPIVGAPHTTNLPRYLESVRQGFTGGYQNYLASSGVSGWSVHYPPHPGGAGENLEPFLEAKAGGFLGSLGDFMRDGFTLEVKTGRTADGGSQATQNPAASNPPPPPRELGFDSVARALGDAIDLFHLSQQLSAESAELDRRLEEAVTPTSRRRVQEPEPSVTLTLRERLLATQGGAVRERRRFMPRLPDPGPGPSLDEILNGANTSSTLRALASELRERIAVLYQRMSIAQDNLRRWGLPLERRVVNEPTTGGSTLDDVLRQFVHPAREVPLAPPRPPAPPG